MRQRCLDVAVPQVVRQRDTKLVRADPSCTAAEQTLALALLDLAGHHQLVPVQRDIDVFAPYSAPGFRGLAMVQHCWRENITGPCRWESQRRWRRCVSSRNAAGLPIHNTSRNTEPGHRRDTEAVVGRTTRLPAADGSACCPSGLGYRADKHGTGGWTRTGNRRRAADP